MVLRPGDSVASAPEEPALRPPAPPHAILVVDDEPAIRESLELTLGDDYRVFTAATVKRGSRSSSASGSR
jgi:response regulator RpfG family c-di-GMP phosphodiesterase